MIEVQTANGRAVIGGNNPPDRFTLFNEHISELMEQAKQFLDGEPIETDAQAEDVSRLMSMLRKAGNDADEARKDEKRPHDEAAKAVQQKWKPVLDAADLAVTTCKKALAPFLLAKEEAQRAAAEAARQEAERQAAAARKAAENASCGDLAAQTTVQVLTENAAALEKQANRLEKSKAHAKGGERAVGLRSTWTAQILDPVAFGKWAWEHRKEEYLAFLTALSLKEARHCPRDIPGLKFNEERKAV